jgi:hypothetical protein
MTRSLLWEVARQYVRDNNGRLLLSAKYLRKRGWKSADVIARAKRELLDGGFIFQTVQGHRPNKASWYAVTWHPLDRIPGYDAGAARLFGRSAYEDPAAAKRRSWSGARNRQGWDCTVSRCRGARPRSAARCCPDVHGRIACSVSGNHLEMPSVAA